MELQRTTAIGPARPQRATAIGPAPRRRASLRASEQRWMSSCEWAWISEARRHFRAGPRNGTERDTERAAEPLPAASDRMQGFATG